MNVKSRPLTYCAAAEKLSALQTAEYFAGRAAKGSLSRFDEIMSRQGGEAPVVGDENHQSLIRP
jgi:hypothetical protein